MDYFQRNQEFIMSRQKTVLSDQINRQMFELLKYRKRLMKQRIRKMDLFEHELFVNHIFNYEYMIELNELHETLVNVNDLLGRLALIRTKVN